MAKFQSVDLSPFFVDEGIVVGQPATNEQLDCAKIIDQVCREYGFLHVTGFGIPASLQKQAFAASAELFGQENNESNLHRWDSSSNIGYSPLQSESLNHNRPADLKEAFNIRFPPSHINDFKGCPPSFQMVSDELLTRYRLVAVRFAMACALALKLPQLDFISKTISKMDLCTIRFLHYPPCDSDSTGATTNLPIRIGEHTDFGAFTFLLLGENGAEGLQIKSVEGGEIGGSVGGEEDSGWINVDIPPDGGGAIVNTGAQLARWTNDTWNATAHRVIVPSQLEAGRDRYSIAFFVDTDSEAMVEVHDIFTSEESPCRYEPISGQAYLQMKLSEMSNPIKNK